jgi:CBS domain-containing protein
MRTIYFEAVDRLGKQSRDDTMKVSQIMRTPVVVVQENTSLEAAARLMLEHDLRGIPVVNELGKLCGFLSVSDFMAKDKSFVFARFHAPQLFGEWIPADGIESLYEEARTKTVGEIMSRSVVKVTEDDSIEDVIELLLYRELNRIPVVRDDIPVGIIARYDLLKLVVERKLMKVTQEDE